MSAKLQVLRDRLKGRSTRLFHRRLWELREELNEHAERFEAVTNNGEEHIRKKKGSGRSRLTSETIWFEERGVSLISHRVLNAKT